MEYVSIIAELKLILVCLSINLTPPLQECISVTRLIVSTTPASQKYHTLEASVIFTLTSMIQTPGSTTT